MVHFYDEELHNLMRVRLPLSSESRDDYSETSFMYIRQFLEELLSISELQGATADHPETSFRMLSNRSGKNLPSDCWRGPSTLYICLLLGVESLILMVSDDDR